MIQGKCPRMSFTFWIPHVRIVAYIFSAIPFNSRLPPKLPSRVQVRSVNLRFVALENVPTFVDAGRSVHASAGSGLHKGLYQSPCRW